MASARLGRTPIDLTMRSRWPRSAVTALAAPVAAAPVLLLAAPALILAGAALLAWDYALLPATPLDHVLYWSALGVGYAGVVALGTVERPGWPRQVVALMAFGALTWLPYFLRSPERLLFVDERFHLDIVQRAVAAGHVTGLDVRLFLLPGTFPGIEDATLALMAWTGLSPVLAARIITLAIHATIPALAYAVARGLRIGRRGAFLAGLVYAANTSFLFFHSVFSYESLGILLFLSSWVLVALHRRRTGRVTPDDLVVTGEERPRRIQGDRAVLLLAVPLVAAVAITHHVTSYLLFVTLAFAWLMLRLVRSPSTRFVGGLAILAGVFAAAWFLVSRDRVEPYLVNSISDRLNTIVQTLLIEHSQPRALFANSDLPVLERLVAFAYPPLVALLSLVGIVAVWRLRPRSSLWLPLAFAGPLAWIATTPAVLTRSGEVAYRLWPFLFVGVAAFVAVGLVRVARRVSRRHPTLDTPVAFGLAAVLLMGGFSVGDNQASRFPGRVPVTSAGSGNLTTEAEAAAHWLRDTAGEGHLVATDSGNGSIFATDGAQRILRWQSWFPFVARDPAEIVPFMVTTGIDYLVVDGQITELPPRYGKYFDEPDIPVDLEPGTPFPAALLDRLDGLTGLSRIYDSGRYRIYARTELATDPGAVP
jgi:hypothetical protein